MSIIRKKKKSKKRPSPFRVKVGCVVALRYQPGDNPDNVKRVGGESESSGADNGSAQSTSSSNMVEVWADPRPGRDDGLALIGRRIRVTCHTDAGEKALEGEVVAFLDQKRDGTNGTTGTATVSLLIDQDVAERDYDFLPLDPIASGTTNTYDCYLGL